MKKTFLEKAKRINKIATTLLMYATVACSGKVVSYALIDSPKPPLESSADTIDMNEKSTETDTYALSDDASEKSDEVDTNSHESCEDDSAKPCHCDGTVLPDEEETETLKPLSLDQLSTSLKEKLRDQQDTGEFLCGLVLSPEEKIQLFSYLMSNPPFKNLILIGRDIDDNDIEKLAKVLKTNTYLTNIDLSYNHISDSGIAILVDVLKENSTIVSINLSNNRISNKSVRIIANMIRESKRQIDINIKNNLIGDSGVRQIASAMIQNPSYQRVSLSCMEQPKSALTTDLANKRFTASFSRSAMFISLLSASKVEEIDFSGCILSDSDVTLLAEFLKNNRLGATRRLNLSHTGFNAHILEPLMESLKTNTTIVALDLSDNVVEDDGVKAIANMLKVNSTITDIHLQNTGIRNDGLRYLLDHIRPTSTLKCCDLRKNNIYCDKVNWSEVRHPMTILLDCDPTSITLQPYKYISYQMVKQNSETMLIITIPEKK